jgi:hypothetical protein
MNYQVFYVTPSGQSFSEFFETETPKEAIQAAKDKHKNIQVLQVTMEVKVND